MDFTQTELAEKLKIARNTVARMESGRQAITPSMALLISFVARESGVDATHPKRGRSEVKDQRKVARKSTDSVRSHGSRTRKGFLPK
jgi:transcriptional regulator with XRE-family HTH domain